MDELRGGSLSRRFAIESGSECTYILPYWYLQLLVLHRRSSLRHNHDHEQHWSKFHPVNLYWVARRYGGDICIYEIVYFLASRDRPVISESCQTETSANKLTFRLGQTHDSENRGRDVGQSSGLTIHLQVALVTGDDERDGV